MEISIYIYIFDLIIQYNNLQCLIPIALLASYTLLELILSAITGVTWVKQH